MANPKEGLLYLVFSYLGLVSVVKPDDLKCSLMVIGSVPYQVNKAYFSTL